MSTKYMVTNTQHPILKGVGIITQFSFGMHVSDVIDGVLVKGNKSLKVSGKVVRYPSGRIEVNGKSINWDDISEE